MIFLPSQILPFFRTISSQCLPFQFLSGSQQTFIPTFWVKSYYSWHSFRHMFFGHYNFIFFLAEPTTHLNCCVDSDISPCCPWLPAHHLPLACVTTISKCSNPCIWSLFSGKSLTPLALLSAQSLPPVWWFFLSVSLIATKMDT